MSGPVSWLMRLRLRLVQAEVLTCEELVGCQAVVVQKVQVAWEGQMFAEAAGNHRHLSDVNLAAFCQCGYVHHALLYIAPCWSCC